MSKFCTHSVPIDTPCLKCALANGAPNPEFTPRELLARADENLVWAISEAKAAERSRIRALFLKYYSNDWNAVQFLKEMDE